MTACRWVMAPCDDGSITQSTLRHAKQASLPFIPCVHARVCKEKAKEAQVLEEGAIKARHGRGLS